MAIRSRYASRSSSLTRERDHDTVGQLEPGALAHGVERVDEVEHAAFAAQFVVERGVEGDADAVVLGDRPALERHALAADHLVGLEHLAGRAQPAVVELLDVTLLERGPHLGQLGAEPRPEQAQVRQQLHAGDGPLVESDLLDAQLLSDLVGVPRGRARAAHEHPAQRLSELEVRLAARATAELDDVAHRGDLRKQLFVARALAARRASRRGARRRARPGTAPVISACHRCSLRNGSTGATTRGACTRAIHSVRNAASSNE